MLLLFNLFLLVKIFKNFKGILALILNQTCRIHESSLLLAVRTCFNIYLASKSPINQSTAKGILTQTINYVFTNMERNVVDTVVIPFDENSVKYSCLNFAFNF